MVYSDELYHWGKKGMRWGVRRYQNKDGSLTPAGQKRYARDQRENAGKKKGNKVGAADPHRWVREDMERSKRLTDSSAQAINQVSKQLKTSTEPHKRMDLSSMTDQELRDRINRENLEIQYDRLFNQQETMSKGRQYVTDTLDMAGSILGIAGSAIGVALAIKELKG